MIYYVEDDENIRNLVVYALGQKGLEVRGFACSSELYAACKQELPELFLLDIMLPEENGLAILAHLRADERTAALPVMMITARDAEYDVVSGLDAGADDYLAKPFGMMELVSRVNALLRRSASLPAGNAAAGEGHGEGHGERQGEGGAAVISATAALTLGPIVLRDDRHEVRVSERRVELTLKEYDLLHVLMRNRGLVCTREHLLETVWGWRYEGNTRTVDVHIQTLRSKLGAGAACIETVRGVGYRTRDEAERHS